MTRSEDVTVQVPSAMKRQAEKALAMLGVTPEEAIAEFYQQIATEYRAGGDAWLEDPSVSLCLCWASPPNDESLAAMKEVTDANAVRFGSVAELKEHFEKAAVADHDDMNA